MKIRTAAPSSGSSLSDEEILAKLSECCRDIVQPFIMGCDTRSINVVQSCLTAIQRIVNHEIVESTTAKNIVCVLWQIYEQGSEELQLRLLQTVIVLVTSKSCNLHGQSLSQAIVLCFRLHFTKNEVTNNTAEATIRQVVSLVFDRVVSEDKENPHSDQRTTDVDSNKNGATPVDLSPAVDDAHKLFQDLCHLVNADSPQWLVGITEMTRTFGLELLENVLVDYEDIFNNHTEFKFLLKDRVCSLVIRLFSPNIKHRQGAPPPPAGASPNSNKDKPYYPISLRLCRVVAVLLKKYHPCLVTESEIFLSLLNKFLETEKPTWQRALAIEVLNQLCAQPKLMKSFCIAYDLQLHSTKVFGNVVSSLCSLSQDLMYLPSGASSIDQMSIGSNNSLQLSSELSSLTLSSSGTIKHIFLEAMDKTEAPSIQDNYLLSVVFLSLLDLIKGLASMISAVKSGTETVSSLKSTLPDDGQKTRDEDRTVLEEMMNVAWMKLLTVLNSFLEVSTDESSNESVFKAVESLAGICGLLGMNAPRDAFIAVLCKHALPLNYPVSIVNKALSVVNLKETTTENMPQMHVVAVGHSLPSGGENIPSALGAVSLTYKSLQSMRTLLTLSNCYGAYMSTAWQLILTTLQHLVWILGLEPVAGGQLRPGTRSSNDGNASSGPVLTTAVLSDLPVLSTMLSELFEASKHLDDVALHHLINALCSLSVEAMDTAFNANVKEPSLFAVAKLLETGLVNIDRIEILWRPVTGHLLEVCQHPNAILREWGAEGATALVKAALKHFGSDKLVTNPKLLHMFLQPLTELNTVQHHDVRNKQLESILYILNSSGDSLSPGWPLVLSVIGSATDTQSDVLVRLGFKSVQLVISDYLLSLPPTALPICIDVIGQYAHQDQEFNISLTAIGLLWSLSDHMHHNHSNIEITNGKGTTAESIVNKPDYLWMYLFHAMGKLCVDTRPAIRKSAGQTLFSTLSAHWSNISTDTWHQVIWEVLFPLMENVQKACVNAPTCKAPATNDNIMMHHSRDTEKKQWQETSVLTLAGIARVFKTKRLVLLQMENFDTAWDKVLEFIQNAATSSSIEVSRAALCSFEEVLNPIDSITPKQKIVYRKAWNAWCNIGIKVTIPPPPGQTSPDEMLTQAYLTSLVLLFPSLHCHLADQFDGRDFKHLSQVLYGAVCVPIRSDSTAFHQPGPNKVLTPLQQAVMNSIDIVQKSVSSSSDTSIYPAVFKCLLSIVDFASNAPCFGDIKNYNGPPDKTKWVAVNYVAFSEYCMHVVADLYQITACHKAVASQGILCLIIKSIRNVIKHKYGGRCTETWQLAVNMLIKILQAGLPVVRQLSQHNATNNLWEELCGCLEDCLFPSTPAPATLSVEEHNKLESYDILVVEMIRSEVLPYRLSFPKSFLNRVVSLLNKGSIPLSTRDLDIQIGSNRSRDEFSQQCFNILLQFSMLPAVNGDSSKSSSADNNNSSSISEINEMTVQSLVQRCRSALVQYVSSDRLKTHFPLSETQIKEVMFSLKALNQLLQSLLNLEDKVNDVLWNNVFDLYPVLVECIPSSSLEVRVAVAQVIGQFQHFLKVR